MEKNQQKSKRRIENVGINFRPFENDIIHVEFVKEKVSYTADFPTSQMIVYAGEASGYACMHIGDSPKMVKLVIRSTTGFAFSVQNGETTEAVYEMSFVKCRESQPLAFYVRKMCKVA